jgi:hypothetical protein
MAKFTMTIDFDIHEHAPSAHRAFIATALDLVKMDIGRGVLTEGDIVDPGGGAQAQAPIGRWEMTEDF